MTISAIAFLPNPPVLLPGLTGRPVAEVEELRAACLSAIAEVLETRPDEIVVLGSAKAHEVGGPLSVRVGRSLLAEAGTQLPVSELAVAADADIDELRAAGENLAGRPLRIAVMVMGDGTACRTLKAPGYLDERAAPYDERIGAALTSAEPQRLLELDRGLADDLLVAGWPAWQAAGWATRGHGPWDGELLHASDPFGVYYAVAVWRAA